MKRKTTPVVVVVVVVVVVAAVEGKAQDWPKQEIVEVVAVVAAVAAVQKVVEKRKETPCLVVVCRIVNLFGTCVSHQLITDSRAGHWVLEVSSVSRALHLRQKRRREWPAFK